MTNSANSTTTTHPVNSKTLLDAALYYAEEADARVFPLQPNSKRPLFPESWAEYATKDPDIIKQWWTDHPQANIALVADMRFAIFDLDQKDGKRGIDSFRELFPNAVQPLQPNHPVQTTPSNDQDGRQGRHVFFRHPVEYAQPFRNLTNKGPYGGIDIRSGNAYVVMAPSTIDGVPYRLQGDLNTAPNPGDIINETLLEWEAVGEATVSDMGLPMPEVDPALVVDYRTLPEHLQVYLETGHTARFKDDDSAALMSIASTLYLSGYNDQQVLSSLATWPVTLRTARKRQTRTAKAVRWLWAYTCMKARVNRQSTPTEVFAQRATLLPLDEIRSIDDFNRVREEYLTPAMQLPPAERSAAISRLKVHMKSLGVAARAIDDEVRQLVRRQPEEKTGNPANPALVFPQVDETNTPLAVLENFTAMVDHYKIDIRYNLMSHTEEVDIPSFTTTGDNNANVKFSTLRDLMTSNGMANGRANEFQLMQADANAYHPVAKIITDTEWDGVDRISQVASCLILPKDDRNEISINMRNKLFTTWMVSGAAVLSPYGNMPPRGVLTIAGPQGVGKTSFFRKIVMPGCFGEGIHLDPHDKDSVAKAVSYHVTELGELDGILKRNDITALKSFISNTNDELREAYAAKKSKWQRRTIFSATVNQTRFLRDMSGNSRFWSIWVHDIDLDKVDWILPTPDHVAQLWAQAQAMLDDGCSYLLNEKELVELEKVNELHREQSSVEVVLRDKFEWDEPHTHLMSASEIASRCEIPFRGVGYNPFHDPLVKLTKQLGPRKTYRDGKQGRYWLMPPVKHTAFPDKDAMLTT